MSLGFSLNSQRVWSRKYSAAASSGLLVTFPIFGYPTKAVAQGRAVAGSVSREMLFAEYMGASICLLIQRTMLLNNDGLPRETWVNTTVRRERWRYTRGIGASRPRRAV